MMGQLSQTSPNYPSLLTTHVTIHILTPSGPATEVLLAFFFFFYSFLLKGKKEDYKNNMV